MPRYGAELFGVIIRSSSCVPDGVHVEGLIYSTACVGGQLLGAAVCLGIIIINSNIGQTYIADHMYSFFAFVVLLSVEVLGGELIGRLLCDGSITSMAPGAKTSTILRPGMFSLAYLTLSLFFFVL